MCATDPNCNIDHTFMHFATFECACGRKWQCMPGPNVACPKCKSLYVRWTDFARFAAEKAVVYAGVAD